MKYLLILICLLFLFPSPAHAITCSSTVPTITFAGWSGDTIALRRGFYVWDESNCWYIPSLPMVDINQNTPAYFETRAIWMAAGVIEVSATLNGLDMNGVEGFVALLNCDLVGTDVWVRPNASSAWSRVRIADCVMPEHEYFHAVYVDSGLELSYELAQRFGAFEQQNPGGGVGIYGFEVCLTEIGQCAGTPVNYSDWFLDQAIRIRRTRR